jgi:hypothetical protein
MGFAACPDCFSTSDLAKIERLTGEAGVTLERRELSGTEVTVEVTMESNGDSHADWDTATQVGICCHSCGFRTERPDWMTLLVWEPSLRQQISAIVRAVESNGNLTRGALCWAALCITEAEAADPKTVLLEALIQGDPDVYPLEQWPAYVNEVSWFITRHLPGAVAGALRTAGS